MGGWETVSPASTADRCRLSRQMKQISGRPTAAYGFQTICRFAGMSVLVNNVADVSSRPLRL